MITDYGKFLWAVSLTNLDLELGRTANVYKTLFSLDLDRLYSYYRDLGNVLLSRML